jgi:membrane-bound inhibitor of C-type lysozyme
MSSYRCEKAEALEMIHKKLIVLALISNVVFATPLPDQSFKSPSFNGSGYSSHVLTIENQEYTRKQQIAKDIQAALDKAKSEANNTNIQKFLNNLESRIYAQISQNLATAMFANGGSNSGSLNFEGNTIFWTKDSSNVYLTVTDTVGNQTQITVPLGQFIFQ